MKIFQSSIFRAICAIIVGVLLIKYPQEGVTWLTITIGCLFLLSGIISLIAYWNAKKHAGDYTITDQQGRVISGTKPTFPIVGLGSVILGLTLALRPETFINGLMYILGAIMILGGINQLMALFSARRFASVSLGYWIGPSLVLLVGLFVIFKPMETAEMPLLILGWCSLVYGVTEMINSLKIYSIRKKVERQQKDSERQQNDDGTVVAEEISSVTHTTPTASEEETETYSEIVVSEE